MVPEFEGRRPIGGARDKAVDDIPANMRTGLVAVGVGLSGVIDTKARELDGEGSQLAGWGLRREEGAEEASEEVLNRGEGGLFSIGVRTNALDKLPLLLERLLNRTVGRLGKVLTCCCEGVDGRCPCGGLGGKPIETGGWVTNVTTKVTMARANLKVGIAALIDGIGG